MVIHDVAYTREGDVVMNITLSSAGSVTCAVNSSSTDIMDMEVIETPYNRYFYRSNVSAVNTFYLDHTPGVEERLYCMALCLQSRTLLSDSFISEPFYVSCGVCRDT